MQCMDVILAILCMGLSITTTIAGKRYSLIVEYLMMITHCFITANRQTIVNVGTNKSDIYTLCALCTHCCMQYTHCMHLTTQNTL